MSEFKWSGDAAWRKLVSGISVSVGPFSKQVVGDHNPNRDAYRNCANCGKHYNYHKNNKCP